MNLFIKILFSVILTCFGLSGFAQKMEYELPVEMSESVRSQYEVICEKGFILYNINCGSCHTKSVRRKKIIPDFEASKLAGYEIRVMNPQHTSHIEEDKLTPEELVLIVTFLNYKKKSWIDPKGNKIPH